MEPEDPPLSTTPKQKQVAKRTEARMRSRYAPKKQASLLLGLTAIESRLGARQAAKPDQLGAQLFQWCASRCNGLGSNPASSAEASLHRIGPSSSKTRTRFQPSSPAPSPRCSVRKATGRGRSHRHRRHQLGGGHTDGDRLSGAHVVSQVAARWLLGRCDATTRRCSTLLLLDRAGQWARPKKDCGQRPQCILILPILLPPSATEPKAPHLARRKQTAALSL